MNQTYETLIEIYFQAIMKSVYGIWKAVIGKKFFGQVQHQYYQAARHLRIVYQQFILLEP